MTGHTSQYIREILHHTEPPPPIKARFFYTSPLAIDDPLSPLPPPATAATASTSAKQPPRPFSEYDDGCLEKAWLELRKKILKWGEDRGEKSEGHTLTQDNHEAGEGEGKRFKGKGPQVTVDAEEKLLMAAKGSSSKIGMDGQAQPELKTSLESLDGATLSAELDVTNTTGTPFIRAPSRRNLATTSTARDRSRSSRPSPKSMDSYKWDDTMGLQRDEEVEREAELKRADGPVAKVPVGVSRLHNVVMPNLQMEPIYWSPVNDLAVVVRATWFYKDTMLPVETPVANMLEAGYTELQVWTGTWQDELNSAVEVGAAGEEKILRKLWPDIPLKQRDSTDSRPSTARGEMTGMIAASLMEDEPDTPESRREREVEAACDIIDVTSGAGGPDNKAAGVVAYGRYGPTKIYPAAGILYANATEAHILKPNLQPSTYYGRRPLANYIRKNRQLGIPVVRGFDQAAWDKLHPPKKDATTIKAEAGVSTSQGGAPPSRRQKSDPQLARSERPKVTDLVFVIHGIGQKLSERMESYHFTHAINAFRREVNVELGHNGVKSQLRKDGGGIMVLPINWRHSLSFDDGGYRNESDDSTLNHFSLKDITPDTLPSVRNIVSDVMLDIPYYLSHHQPKMIAAVIREANRIYKLWCANNPGFANEGRVHIIAHSLGSVMAIDVLSQQPTSIPPKLRDPTKVDLDAANLPHFLFNTTNLFLAGSPAGFFILLKRASLLPRIDREKPSSDDTANTHSVCGEQGTYGCIAVDNAYNIINPYDPVSYRLNACVDATHAAALKSAWIPSATASWFSSSSSTWFGNSSEGRTTSLTSSTLPSRDPLPRLPSNVELETHNFTREEIAEKRMYALNDNGQIDFLMRYGGGPLDIQYLTMLGAHSSYWISRDFVRMIVLECGRRPGREGALSGMRAVKRKAVLG